MTNERNERLRDKNALSRDIHAYVKNRTDKQGEKAAEARKHVEIQLLFSELENLLLKMKQTDPQVLTIRHKLFELKIAFYKLLDIK